MSISDTEMILKIEYSYLIQNESMNSPPDCLVLSITNSSTIRPIYIPHMFLQELIFRNDLFGR